MSNTILMIRTEQEYDTALVRIQSLIRIHVAEHTPEFEELGTLIDAVEAYEREHYPVQTALVSTVQ